MATVNTEDEQTRNSPWEQRSQNEPIQVAGAGLNTNNSVSGPPGEGHGSGSFNSGEIHSQNNNTGGGHPIDQIPQPSRVFGAIVNTTGSQGGTVHTTQEVILDATTSDFDVSRFEKDLRVPTKELGALARRDKFISDLITNKVSSKTNFVTKKEAFDKAHPLMARVTRNNNHHEMVFHTDNTMDSNLKLMGDGTQNPPSLGPGPQLNYQIKQSYRYQPGSVPSSCRNTNGVVANERESIFLNDPHGSVSSRNKVTMAASRDMRGVLAQSNDMSMQVPNLSDNFQSGLGGSGKMTDTLHNQNYINQQQFYQQQLQQQQLQSTQNNRLGRNIFPAHANVLKSHDQSGIQQATRRGYFQQAGKEGSLNGQMMNTAMPSPRQQLLSQTHPNQGGLANMMNERGVDSNASLANKQLLQSLQLQTQSVHRRPYQRKLSPLEKREQKVIHQTNYKEYQNQTNIIPGVAKKEVLQNIDSQGKMQILMSDKPEQHHPKPEANGQNVLDAKSQQFDEPSISQMQFQYAAQSAPQPNRKSYNNQQQQQQMDDNDPHYMSTSTQNNNQQMDQRRSNQTQQMQMSIDGGRYAPHGLKQGSRYQQQPQSWVHVPTGPTSHLKQTNDPHHSRRKNQEELLQQIKLTEQAIKEKRRQVEKMRKNVDSERQTMQNQINMTQQVLKYHQESQNNNHQTSYQSATGVGPGDINFNNGNNSLIGSSYQQGIPSANPSVSSPLDALKEGGQHTVSTSNNNQQHLQGQLGQNQQEFADVNNHTRSHDQAQNNNSSNINNNVHSSVTSGVDQSQTHHQQQLQQQQQVQQAQRYSKLSMPSLELHNLYSGLIKGDFEAVTQRTKQQCDLYVTNQKSTIQMIANLREQNTGLKRTIKIYMEAIQAEKERIRQVKVDGVNDKGSEFGFSVSFSYSGGGGGSSHFDINKVEKINKHVQAMIYSKSALDCSLSILAACKEAFKNLSRATIFVVDPYLQALLLRAPKFVQSQKMRQVPIEDTQSGQMLAIFFRQEEYCAPSFRDTAEGKKLKFTQKMICVPSVSPLDEEQVIFCLQIETDIKQQQQTGATGFDDNKRSSQSPMGKGKGPGKAGAVTGNFSNKTKMSFHQSQIGKKTSGGGWKQSDLFITRLISILGHCRFEIFVDSALVQKKHDTQKQVIHFVNDFSNHKTHKEILRSVKNDIPKLLGFSEANVYLHDPAQHSLLALSLDEEAERMANEADPKGFEREFNFEQRQIVKFPDNMGLSGFAFVNDGIVFVNGFDRIASNKASTAMPSGVCHAIARHQYSTLAKKLMGTTLTKTHPFNDKADNFIDVKTIKNLLISSIEDEHVLNRTTPVGVLQLYNKMGGGEIQDEDLNRIFYMRKLIGAAVIRCEFISMTLQLVLGLCMDRDKLHNSEKNVELVNRTVFDGPSGAMQQCLMMIKRPVDTVCQANQVLNEQNAKIDKLGKGVKGKYFNKNFALAQLPGGGGLPIPANPA